MNMAKAKGRRTEPRTLSLAIPIRQKYGETASGNLWHAYDKHEEGTLCRGHELVKATPKPKPSLSCSICNGIVLRRLELAKLKPAERRALPSPIRKRWRIK